MTLITPTQPKEDVRFVFNGRSLVGKAGDTIASALLRNGVKVVGRSFKFRRARGVMSAGPEEAGAFVTVAWPRVTLTNLRATEVYLTEGLAASSINTWPSPSFSFLGILDVFHRILRAGFYYKTFTWPSWKFFEPVIRRVAGMGALPACGEGMRFEKFFLQCDHVVVGSGKAGLSACLAAAERGEKVVLCEREAEFGGSLRIRGRTCQAETGATWLSRTLDKLRGDPNVRLLSRTNVAIYTEHNLLIANEIFDQTPGKERLWEIRARRITLATGALERPLVFPDNDLPGVMLASAVRKYAKLYDVAAGSRIVLVTNNSSSYHLLEDLRAAGIAVIAVIDTRQKISNRERQAVHDCGAEVFVDHCITRVYGRNAVHGVRVSPRTEPHIQQHFRCDVVAMSGGWNPVVHLFSQAGGKLRYDEVQACFVPADNLPGVTVVGAAAGALGHDVEAAPGLHSQPEADPPSDHPFEITPFWSVPASLSEGRRQWVDFMHDVTADDIAVSVAENFISVEHLKRYTTLGMAPDQGKTSNINGLAILAELTGRRVSQVGTTTFRPPYSPVSFGAIAGRAVGELYQHTRLLPTHERQTALNAKMEHYGAWLRPAFYHRGEECESEAVKREVVAVRNAVGVCDYSPLGKIIVKGSDAELFLNKLVMTDLRTLKIGKARYNLLLNDAGNVMDDGIVSRLDEQEFLVGTTSGNAARVYEWFEEWHQCEWPELNVFIQDVTTGWGVILVSGPNARRLLSRIASDIDFSQASFAHMSIKSGTMLGQPARVQRVSFTGELSYEVSVPAKHLSGLWDEIILSGSDFGVTPFGIESLLILRAEKGFIHVGTDTDGTTIPSDIGFGAVVEKKRIDFVGRRSLQMAFAKDSDRLDFVGLQSSDSQIVLPVGGQIIFVRSDSRESEGFVSSSYFSPTLGRSIALGRITRGRQRVGEEVTVYAFGRTFAATITHPTFYDPSGTKINA